jgi:putative tricarboxylic transport membrane protein
MRIGNAILGALIALLGAVVFWHVQGFPNIPGQKFGASLFPSVISAGMVICGGLLAMRGIREAARGGRLLVIDDWARDPVVVLRFVSVPAGILFYVLTSNFLGFHIAASLAMLGWLLLFGLKPLPAVAMAVVFPALMHLAFYKLLRVPLPWGLLEKVVFP